MWVCLYTYKHIYTFAHTDKGIFQNRVCMCVFVLMIMMIDDVIEERTTECDCVECVGVGEWSA